MSKKLFVGGISWNTDNEQLAEHFAQCGNVLEAKVVTDRETGRSRGFGFVTMEEDGDAERAVEELDGSQLDGRNIAVSEARESNTNNRRPSGGGGGGGGRPSSFRPRGRQ